MLGWIGSWENSTKYQVPSTHRGGQATYEVPGRKYSRNTVEINRASQPAAGWLGERWNSGVITTYFTELARRGG